MQLSDFSSRNPAECLNKDKCQICKFAEELDLLGDNSSQIRTLSVEDMAQAEEAIVRFVQEHSFQEEMTALKREGSVRKSSCLFRLDPVLVDGVLRVGGRLRRSALPEEVKHPAILPKEGHVSTLILHHIHHNFS